MAHSDVGLRLAKEEKQKSDPLKKILWSDPLQKIGSQNVQTRTYEDVEIPDFFVSECR